MSKLLRFNVGKLVTGTGQVLELASLIVQHGQIMFVGKQSDAPPEPNHDKTNEHSLNNERSLTIDAPNSTLMPGMIDVHVHLAYSGNPDKRTFRAEAIDASYPRLALRAAKYAHNTLKAGFTAVRDMNAPGGVIIDLRDAINAGDVPGPHIRACGLGLSITGGHMDQPGFGDQVALRDMTAPCDGATAFRLGVREQVKRGADFIKINLCVGSRATELPYRQEMHDEEIHAAIDEATRLGVKVAAHTSGGDAIYKAIQEGLHTVEHGHWIDDKTADVMAERGAYYVPTLLVNERNFDFGQKELGVSDAAWQWLERAREDKWASLERIHRAGVNIAVGTDAGFMLPHGLMNAIELELLVEGGLTPLEALTAATKTSADLLDMPHIGSLEVGKHADLVLVPGDPTQDVTLLQGDLRVFQAGKEVV